MSTTILATKLYRPLSRPAAVLRHDLIVRLNQGLFRKLTLVAAPAGYGKTTLVSMWVATSDRPTVWLSLDDEDNDLIRFLTYLVAAFQTIRADLGSGALAALQSPQPPPVETILTALLNDIASVPSPLILVLDDYHVIDSEPVDRALTFLLAHSPPQLHLVIATREDPALPLAQLRVRDQMTELRLADLRFGLAEAATFFTEAMNLHLAESDIAALVARTEGWVAGMQLAALSLHGRHDTADFIRSFAGSHRFVIDYLMEEVLNRQPAAMERFLLQTAILDRMCGPLCDAVVRDSSMAGQATLEALERANLFIVPLDDERNWYRYHHLFADVLRQRLLRRAAQRDDTMASVVELHQRASFWYEENGLTHDAFQHAVATGEFERAAGLAELAWFAMFRNSFQNIVFLGWMRALPDDLIRARPILSAGYAWALLDVGNLEAAEIHLHNAEQWLNARPDESASATEMVAADEAAFRALPATIALARATYASATDDVNTTKISVQRALALLPETDHFGRAGASALLGVAYLRSGNLEEAATAFADGIAMIHSIGSIAFGFSGIPPLAGVRIVQGRLREAIRLYERMLRLAMEQGEPPPEGTADLYVGLSELYLAQGDLDSAWRYLQRSEALGKRAGLPEWPRRVQLVQARLNEVKGKLDDTLDLLQEAERHYYRSPLPDLQPLAALKARIWIRQGRLAEAQQWARECGVSVDDELSYMREFEHMTLARLLIARARSSEGDSALRLAGRLLGRLLTAAEAGGRMGSAIEILVLQALIEAMGGSLPSALVLMERALALAEPEGYVRIFVDEGLPMMQLLTRMHNAGGAMQPYLRTLLAAGGEWQAADSASVGPQRLAEPLSRRELEVLRLVAQGLSNREIGERLHLAVSTVKGHNLTIFDKLQVQRRTEAIMRARELGLL